MQLVDCSRVIRFGKIAVIYSPGHGAGWYSWHKIAELLFDPDLVDLIERGADGEEVSEYCRQHYEDRNSTWMACDDLVIAWIPEGSIFRINEYDGAESIVLQDDDDWIVA